MSQRAKHYSVLEVLNSSYIALNFSFYCTKNSADIVESLSSITGKNISLTHDNKTEPSYGNAILLKEYDAPNPKYNFLLSSHDYHSIIPLLEEVCDWLKKYATFDIDTQLKVKLSFDHSKLRTLRTISNMDPVKLVLKINEQFIYSRFPEQLDSPYSLSIKNLAPLSQFLNEEQIEQNIRYILESPHAEFYGIDFSEHTRGILTCNYIGGKEYAIKTKEAKDILEFFILKAYQSLNEESYNKEELDEMKRLTKSFQSIQMAYWDPDIFLNEYKDLKVYVNLNTSRQILKTYWSVLRPVLFEMIVRGNLQRGMFNYDTALGRYQLKNGTLHNTKIKNMDLVSCQVSGIVENCNLVGCKINKSRIYDSLFIATNKITESYLKNVSLNKSNSISRSIIENQDEIINCEINESIVKYATLGANSRIDESSTIIVKQLPLPAKDMSLQVDEIRDYSWIKGMKNSSEDLGFQNEYKR